MASELSRLIEDELRHKGYYVKDDDEKDDEEAPHQALMGALRVEVGMLLYFKTEREAAAPTHVAQ